MEVYDILTQAFDIEVMAEKMYALFKKKEELEIQRINNMVSFFESDACISSRSGHFDLAQNHSCFLLCIFLPFGF